MTAVLSKTKRYGGSIRTFTGKRFWPLDPKPEDVNPEDIAHALSLKVRWQGFCNRFYSVGCHSLRVASVAQLIGMTQNLSDSQVMLLYHYGLLHDAAEAYLADVPSPVKPFIKEWQQIERRVESAILSRFGLPPMSARVAKIIKRADKILLQLESEELFTSCAQTGWPIANIIKVPNYVRDEEAEHLTIDEGAVKTILLEELHIIEDHRVPRLLV